MKDAAVLAISDENRFDAAYKCVMQCALVGLQMHGYRPSTSKPGHHQTAIQTLPLTVALDHQTMVVLDGLRKQRNINNYDGDPISPAVVDECIKQARALLDHVREWLAKHRPDVF